jgi:pimeloyl-ACP methyl ester carboxylesterase
MSEAASLAYDEAGSGPLLVAIHGITENRYVWDPVPLAARFRVIRVDMRGHGDSPLRGSFDVADLAADVHDVVQTAAPGELPLMVGHSMGGVLATSYTAQFPVRGTIVADQPMQVAGMQTLLKQSADALRGGDGFTPFMEAMFSQLYGSLDPQIAAGLAARRILRQDVVLGMWSPLMDLTPGQLDEWIGNLLAIPADSPYLSLHGFDLGEPYAAWLRERVPQALVETAPTVTHYPHLADPEWFVNRVSEFEAALTEPRNSR